MSKGLLILDRDGTLNRRIRGSYLISRDDISIADDLLEIKKIVTHGFKVVIASNQAGISKGLFTLDEAKSLTKEIYKPLGELDDHDIYICPHGICEGCLCRKPKPGLIHRILADHSYSQSDIWMVGDMASDYEAAEASGIGFAGVCWDSECLGVVCQHSLAGAISWIIERSCK